MSDIGVGHWCTFVCGPSGGLDRTALGIAVYSDVDDLEYSRWCGQGKAEERGDWNAKYGEIQFSPPETWELMEKTLGRTGNSMSTVRWECGYATTVWDTNTWDRFYDELILNKWRQ